MFSNLFRLGIAVALFGFGSFILAIKYEAWTSEKTERGKFHEAVLVLETKQGTLDVSFSDPIAFLDAWLRAERALERGLIFREQGLTLPSGTLVGFSSRVTTHEVRAQFDITRGWAENIEICNCRSREVLSLLDRARNGAQAFYKNMQNQAPPLMEASGIGGL